MANSTEEIQYGEESGNFDAVVTNTDLDVTLKTVLQNMKEWYPEINWDALG